MKIVRRRNNVWLAVTGAALLSGCGGGGDGGGNAEASNNPPVAQASDVSIAAANTPIFVNGSRTSDSDNDALSFAWEVISAPEGSAYSLERQAEPVAMFSSNIEGEYVLKLTVSDGEAESTSEATVFIDQDGDGIVAGKDLDADGDMVLNAEDAFPNDPSEFVDSDGNGTGNFAQKDEDGDGELDATDAFPFDPSASTPRVYVEDGFNDNPAVANDTGFAVPFTVGGLIEKRLDGDYFTFSANAGEIVTAVCSSGNDRLKPNVSIADSSARSITSATPSIEGSIWSDGVSLEIPANGQYYLIVSNFNEHGSPDFEYSCDLFYDRDLDGVSDEIELANGLNSERHDSEGDGISDSAEFVAAGSLSQAQAQDIDLDGVPNWLDKDADGDYLADSLEGLGDSDGDGLQRFADTDSDGNGIGDLAEAGANPLNPVDTDRDQSPDYADTDDDADGLLDVNDSERTQAISKSTLFDPENLLVVSGFSSTLDSGTVVEERAFKGKDLTIKGQGFADEPTDNMVVFKAPGKTVNVPASGVVDGSLVVSYPLDTSAEVYVVSDGLQSNGLPVELVNETAPVLDDIGILTAEPGDYVTLNGENFSDPMSVSISGLKAAVNIDTLEDNNVQIQIPRDAKSGEIVAVTQNGVSNRIRFKAAGTVRVGIDLPQGTSTTLDDLILSAGTGESTDFANSYSNSIQKSENTPELITALLKDANGDASSVYMVGFSMPSDYSIDLTADSTAAALTIAATNAFDRVSSDSYTDLRDMIEGLPSVQSMGTSLAEKLASDPASLNELDPAIEAAITASAKEADTAITEALASGVLISAESQTTTFSQPVTITPDEQFGIAVWPEVYGKDVDLTGNVVVENDTQLPMSLQVVDKETGAVLRPHVDDYFSVDVFGGQNAAYFGINKEIDQPNYKNAELTFVTPGTNVPATAEQQVRKLMLLRVGAERVLVPLVSSIIGLDLEARTLLQVIQAFGPTVADELGGYISNGDFAGFGERFANELIGEVASRGPAFSLLVEKLGWSKDQLFKFLLKQNLFGKAASLAEGAIQYGNLLYDANNVPQSVKFDVDWPLSIQNIEPAKIAAEPVSVPIEITGSGFSGFKEYFWSDPVLPQVTVSDQGSNGAGSITLPASSVVAGRKIGVTLPATFLVNAVGPLSVAVEHRSVVAYADPLQIEVTGALELTELKDSAGKPGDVMRIIGSGFSGDILENNVTFRHSSGHAVAAKVISASPGRLAVLIPRGAVSGPVQVMIDGTGSNTLPFDLKSQSVSLSFGDNGALNDDTFAVYLNGKHLVSMSEPSRRVGPFYEALPDGRHTITMKGIEAPDGIGTYFIEFGGVTNIQGDALTGPDLDNGVQKSWTFTVDSTASAASAASMTIDPEIIWEH